MWSSLFPKPPNLFEDMLKKKIREEVLDDDKTSNSSQSTGQKVAKKLLQIIHDSERGKCY